MAEGVRLQPQNTEDKSRGTTQTCTAKSYERDLRMVLRAFSLKFHVPHNFTRQMMIIAGGEKFFLI